MLKAAMDMMPVLEKETTLQRFSRPTLWHSDLHLGNIFVDNQDPTKITNIIDWQFTSIMPAFMQVQWPAFITPPDDYQTGVVKPELPPNFAELDSDEKDFALTERDRALLSKCYEAALVKSHLGSYLALTQTNSAASHLLTACESTYKDGIIPLRDSLMRLSERRAGEGLCSPCSYQFTDDEISKHNLELSQYRGWHELKRCTHELLQTDDDGWVSPQSNFDQVQARHDELFQLYVEREEVSPEEAKLAWFYVELESNTPAWT